jgi:hypothetical protein
MRPDLAERFETGLYQFAIGWQYAWIINETNILAARGEHLDSSSSQIVLNGSPSFSSRANDP